MPSTPELGAEFIGTFRLVPGGCGTAVLAATFPETRIGFVGVQLTFDPTGLTEADAIGHIAGGHLNVAVSVGLWMESRFPAAELTPHFVARGAGAAVAGVFHQRAGSGAESDRPPVESAACGFAPGGRHAFEQTGRRQQTLLEDIQQPLLLGPLRFDKLPQQGELAPRGVQLDLQRRRRRPLPVEGRLAARRRHGCPRPEIDVGPLSGSDRTGYRGPAGRR